MKILITGCRGQLGTELQKQLAAESCVLGPLPERLRNVICCRNPRCITTTEQELPQIFKLTDREQRIYRCVYCEAKAQ